MDSGPAGTRTQDQGIMSPLSMKYFSIVDSGLAEPMLP